MVFDGLKFLIGPYFHKHEAWEKFVVTTNITNFVDAFIVFVVAVYAIAILVDGIG